MAKFCQKYLAAEITRLEKYHQGNLPDSLVEVRNAGILHAPICLPLACCTCHWRSAWGPKQQVIACEMCLHAYSKGMKSGLGTSSGSEELCRGNMLFYLLFCGGLNSLFAWEEVSGLSDKM